MTTVAQAREIVSLGRLLGSKVDVLKTVSEAPPGPFPNLYRWLEDYDVFFTTELQHQLQEAIFSTIKSVLTVEIKDIQQRLRTMGVEA